MIDSASPRVLSAVVLLSLVWFGAAPQLAFGQTPVTAFEELNTRVKVGDSLKVIDRDGRQARGRAIEITPDAIVVTRRGGGLMVGVRF